MKQYNLEKISFKTYLKIMSVSSLGLGIIFGVFAFIVALFNANSVYIAINGEITTGIVAGIIIFVSYPLFVMVMFLVVGIFLYLGFQLIMKLKKKLKVKIKVDEII